MAESKINKIFNGSVITFGGKVSERALKFLLAVFLTRWLSASQVGLYFTGLAVVRLFSSPAVVGLDYGILKYGAFEFEEENWSNLKSIFSISLLIPVIVSILLSILCYSYADIIAAYIFKEPEAGTTIKFVIWGLPFVSGVKVITSTFRGFKRMTEYILLNSILLPLFEIILIFIVYLMGFRLYGALIAFIIANILAFLSGYIYLKYRYCFLKAQFNYKYPYKKVLRYSLPLVFSSIFGILVRRMDTLMIASLSSFTHVAFYNISLKVGNIVTFVSGSFGKVFAPYLSVAFEKENINEIANLYRKITRWSLIVAFPIFSLLHTFSEQILSIFGKDYKSIGILLTVIVFGYLINALVGSVGLMLSMAGKSQIIFLSNLFAFIVNIILNWYLIQAYEGLGAALATAITMSMQNVLLLLLVFYFYQIHPFTKLFLKTIFIAIIMWEGGYILINFSNFISISNWLGIFMYSFIIGMIYLIALYWIGIEKSERLIIKQKIKKLIDLI